MKLRFALLAGLTFFTAQHAGAVVLIAPTSTPVASGSVVNLGTITNAQVAGYSQLIISYSVTISDTSTGWFGLGVNSNASDPVSSMNGTTTNLGALLRTSNGNTHQLFAGTNTGTTNPVSTGNHDLSTTASVRLILNIPNGFTGNSTVSYSIDEGSSTFVTANHNLTGTMTWTGNQAVFTGASLSAGHIISNFRVEAIPEPGSFALATLGGFALLRRKRG